MSNFMEIRPMEAELFHADKQTHEQRDRQTDRHDKAISRFSQFREHKNIH